MVDVEVVVVVFSGGMNLEIIAWLAYFVFFLISTVEVDLEDIKLKCYFGFVLIRVEDGFSTIDTKKIIEERSVERTAGSESVCDDSHKDKAFPFSIFWICYSLASQLLDVNVLV